MARSPALTPFTSGPVSSTTPRNSCPMCRGLSVYGWDLYGHRSLPQTLPSTMRSTASVGCWIFGSATSSTHMSPAWYRSVARMSSAPCASAGCAVFGVADRFAPVRLRSVGVVAVHQGQVGHEPVRHSAVPVFLARRGPDCVARVRLDDGAVAAAEQRDALDD